MQIKLLTLKNKCAYYCDNMLQLHMKNDVRLHFQTLKQLSLRATNGKIVKG